MYIRWKTKTRSKGENAILHIAYLAENNRVEGKPRQTVTYLASIQNGQMDDPQQKRRFWQAIDEKIKTLDLSSQQITTIKTKLSERVPLPQKTVQQKPKQSEEPRAETKRRTKQQEPQIELADFSKIWQDEYKSIATDKDVWAWVKLRPAIGQEPGDYHVSCDWEPTKVKRVIHSGMRQRGKDLKVSLLTAVHNSLIQHGWIVVDESHTYHLPIA